MPDLGIRCPVITADRERSEHFEPINSVTWCCSRMRIGHFPPNSCQTFNPSDRHGWCVPKSLSHAKVVFRGAIQYWVKEKYQFATEHPDSYDPSQKKFQYWLDWFAAQAFAEIVLEEGQSDWGAWIEQIGFTKWPVPEYKKYKHGLFVYLIGCQALIDSVGPIPDLT